MLRVQKEVEQMARRKLTPEELKAKRAAERQKKRDQCFELFMSNPSWRETYENAPSPASKAMWKDILSSMEWGLNAQARKLEKQFTVEDWQYMVDNWANDPLKVHFMEGLEKAKKKAASKADQSEAQ